MVLSRDQSDTTTQVSNDSDPLSPGRSLFDPSDVQEYVPQALDANDVLDDDVHCNLYYADDLAKREKAVEIIDYEKTADNSSTRPPTRVPARSVPLLKKAWEVIDPGYFVNHLDYKLFRTVLPTWIMLFVGTIFQVVNPTRVWFGTAAYLFMIIGAIAAPGGQLFTMATFMSIVMLIGSCIGWLHLTIAMAIQAHIRGWPTKESVVQEIISKGICQANNPKLEDCVSGYMFTGAYFETRCTVIWIIAFMSCLIITRAIFMYNQLLKLNYIMGAITIIITTCYNVYFPYFEPLTVGYQVIKPMWVALALRIVLAAVVFPQSSLFQFINAQTNIIKGLHCVSTNNLRLIRSLRPSKPNFTNAASLSVEVAAKRKGVVALEVPAAMTKFEFCFSRFDVRDVAEIRSAVKNLITAIAGFDYYYSLFEERKAFSQNKFEALGRRATTTSAATYESYATSTFDHKIRSTIDQDFKRAGGFENAQRLKHVRNRLFKVDPKQRVTLKDLDVIATFISDNFALFVDLSDIALELCLRWIDAANHFRFYSKIDGSWKRKREEQQKLATEIKAVIEVMEEQLALSSNSAILEELVKTADLTEDALLCLISQTTLYVQTCRTICHHVHRLLLIFRYLDETKPYPRFVTPFTKNRKDGPQHIFQTDDQLEETEDQVPADFGSRVSKRDPDNSPPSNQLQRIGRVTTKFYDKVVLNGKFWRLVKGAFLVTCLALPFFFRPSTHWFYSNRLVWVVIMTAVSLTETTGQTIYMFGAKVVYTFLGCIVGMVCWYISCANPYGFAAVSGVVFAFLVFHRHFAEHEALIPLVLLTVTTALVLGTSWNDIDNTLLSTGLGWRPAVTRFVSVVAGLAIAAALSLIPRPQLSKILLRRMILNAINECGNLHCLVAKFALKRWDDPSLHITFRHDYITERFRRVFLRIQCMLKLTVDLRHELPIAGYWPEVKYDRLRKLLNDVVQLYFLIYQCMNSVENPKKFMPTCFRRMGWNLTDFLADVFLVICLLSNSVGTCDPLPRVSHATLLIKHMELLLDQWGLLKISYLERWYNNDPPMAGATEEEEMNQLLEEGHEHIIQHLDYKLFFSHDGQCAINILLYSHMMYQAYDEMVVILKSLVGEKFDYNEEILMDVYTS